MQEEARIIDRVANDEHENQIPVRYEPSVQSQAKSPKKLEPKKMHSESSYFHHVYNYEIIHEHVELGTKQKHAAKKPLMFSRAQTQIRTEEFVTSVLPICCYCSFN